MLTVLGGGTPSEEPYKIERSLRFNSADSTHLSRTPIAAGNRKTWTWSGWVKRSGLGTTQYLFSANYASSQLHASLWFNTSDKLQFTGGTVGVSNDFLFGTTQVFRDVSAWYMITISVDTTQATNTNRVKIYVNGSQVTSFSTQTYPSQNYDFSINNNVVHRIGTHTGSADFVNGYLTEVHFIDGWALGPEEFGEIDPNTNVWRPKQYEKEAVSVQYLVIAGGGGGANNAGGGGGAGGYRNSYASEASGANSSTESTLSLATSTTYAVTVGAGGPGKVAGSPGNGTSGQNSIFSTVTSTGGGGGGTATANGLSGGSGGGGSFSGYTGGAGTSLQGTAGGNGGGTSTLGSGGGGGGASVAGQNGVSGASGAGGNGLASSISGSAVTRGGGGGGGTNALVSAGLGGTGGGGNGGNNGASGSTNTGGGGGGGGLATSGYVGGNGGSGVVILRFPSTYNITVGAGLTYSQSTVGSDKVVQFTAGTGTVSFS